MQQSGHVTTQTLERGPGETTHRMGTWLARRDRGSKAWWRELARAGTPLVERGTEGHVEVTFLWRGPTDHVPARVYVHVPSVTNHHEQDPQGLSAVPGTDIWHWRTRLPANWRGSYTFIPSQAQDAPPRLDPVADPRQLAHRAWWRARLRDAQPDPLNPLRSHWAAMGAAFSPLHLPEAPRQEPWRALDEGRTRPACAKPQRLIWTSDRLDASRQAWLLRTGAGNASSADLPLVLLLDAHRWLHTMPLAAVLETQTQRGDLPPAAYLLIDTDDPATRPRDLGCNDAFWQAMAHELLPRVEALLPVTCDPARTIVAGQSLGGLAATYAALAFPDRFGAALSSSGSFWWPEVAAVYASTNAGGARDPCAPAWLAGQVARGAFPKFGARRFFLEVGSREGVMVDVNEAVAAALREAGHHVDFRIYEGGHDPLCWRGGLIDGLRALLGPHRAQGHPGETP